MMPPDQVEEVDDFAAFGVRAFTTTRAMGSFSTASNEPVREVMGRWDAVRAAALDRGVRRLATASQVHGDRLLVHAAGWEGWLRGTQADGHVSPHRGTAMAVTVGLGDVDVGVIAAVVAPLDTDDVIDAGVTVTGDEPVLALR